LKPIDALATHHSLRNGKDGRFAVALGISILIHGILLQYTRPLHSLTNQQGAAGFSVSFRKLQPEETRSVPPENPSPALGLKPSVIRGADEAVSVAMAAGVSPRQAESIKAPAESVGVASHSEASTPSGQRARVHRKPGDVVVLLTIGDNGRPGQIIWGELPALSKAQLDLIEARIRARSYSQAIGGSTLTEEINIFSLLRPVPEPPGGVGD
jgi:hypothetical protein